MSCITTHVIVNAAVNDADLLPAKTDSIGLTDIACKTSVLRSDIRCMRAELLMVLMVLMMVYNRFIQLYDWTISCISRFMYLWRYL